MDKIKEVISATLKANEAIKEVNTWIEENENTFLPMDLKLYDVIYYVFENDINSDLFNLFCEDSYRFFKEFMDENYIDNSIFNHIGRTSSFFLHDLNTIYINRGRYDCIDWDLLTLITEMFNSYTNLDISINENKITIDEDFINLHFEDYHYTIEEYCDDILEDLNYVISDLLNDLKLKFEDTLLLYNYIKDFKENQVEYFKEYLECYNEI